jgi:hypothetical protein
MALLLLLFACIQHDLYEDRVDEVDTCDTASEFAD